MIIERRRYTLRPGTLQRFWAAQATWNTEAVFGPILAKNIAYFSAITGPTDQIVHLYRFDSLEDWQQRYAGYYAAQNPDYFALVRPWMLRQDNGFLVAPPGRADWARRWAGERPTLPEALAPGQDPADACVVETAIDFFPGGLPVYWSACDDGGGSGLLRDANHMASLVALVGRLHRVVHYHVYAGLAQAEAARRLREADPRWHAFVERSAAWVAAQSVLFLQPSPLASRRQLFTQGRP
jgi:hypothetical protein